MHHAYRTVVCDIETDSLSPTKIHVIVAKDIETNERFIFTERDEFRAFSKSVDTWIYHNGIGFDCRAIHSLWGVRCRRVLDTLVLSRLYHQKLKGGHSLEAWGERFKFPKGDFSDFSKYTPEMLEYCIQDVEITHRLYDYLMEKIGSKENFQVAIELEHKIAEICEDMSYNGFRFDHAAATALHTDILQQLSALDHELKTAFPPKSKLVKRMTPRVTKHGTLSKVGMQWYDGDDFTMFDGDSEFSVFKYEEFNPGSPKQIVERLNEAGWKPTEKTKGHNEAIKSLAAARKSRIKKAIVEAEARLREFKVKGWKVNEANLETLPEDAPEAAQKLAERILLDSRRSTLEEWFNAYSTSTRCIHGRFNSLGTWTHRMSHNSPNMGNIPRTSSRYGKEMRSFWCVDDDEYLVGVDAAGIQLRVLAHLINDPEFIYAVTEGKEEDETDIHNVNKRALGDVCKDRNKAKTFIYAFLLGAGVGKIAEIFGCSIKEAAEARSQYTRRYSGLAYLKEERIPKDVERGYFEGLDGRWVACDSDHLMLSGYLQNGEAVIMKHATVRWMELLDKANINYSLCNFVHDEWQLKVKGKWLDALMAGKYMVQALRETGKKLNLNCPMDGNIKIGKNWCDTH